MELESCFQTEANHSVQLETIVTLFSMTEQLQLITDAPLSYCSLQPRVEVGLDPALVLEWHQDLE